MQKLLRLRQQQQQRWHTYRIAENGRLRPERVRPGEVVGLAGWVSCLDSWNGLSEWEGHRRSDLWKVIHIMKTWNMTFGGFTRWMGPVVGPWVLREAARDGVEEVMFSGV